MHYVKRISIQKKRDVELLKSRLDVYNDEWRIAQPDPDARVKLPTKLKTSVKVRKPRLRKLDREQIPADLNNSPNKELDNTLLVGPKGIPKRKRTKSDKVIRVIA